MNNGTLDLGLGTTTLVGTFTQGAGGALATTVDGSQVGKLSLNGTASLAGSLAISTTGVPTDGSILPIVSAPSRSGTFASVTGGSAGGGLTYSVGYTSPGVVLYVGVPGGSISLKKSTALYGHYSDKVSGSGWTAHADTSVTVNQCATPFYTADTCDAANKVPATLGTGAKAGTFKNAKIKLAVGVIDADGDTCGTSTASLCYIVVVGNSGDFTSSGVLGFALPNATAKKTAAVAADYVDKITAADFPGGDTVTARECDTAVNPATDLSSNCDTATVITGTASKSGKVTFTTAGVTVLIGTYSDGASGTVVPGGAADLVVNDSTTPGISVVIPITVAG